MTSQLSGFVLRTLSWVSDEDLRASPTTDGRAEIVDEAIEWQALSSYGQEVMKEMMPEPWPRKASKNGVHRVIPAGLGAPQATNLNRVVEVHAIAGAVGEQLGLAVAAEQDVQRLISTREGRTPEFRRAAERAMCEIVNYFSLAAAHALGNLFMRLCLFNTRNAETLDPSGSRFQVGSDDRKAWPSLSQVLRAVKPISLQNTSLARFRDALQSLAGDADYVMMENRRGLDFHRLRPQSLAHASTPRQFWAHDVATGASSLVVGAPSLPTPAYTDAIYPIAVSGLKAVSRIAHTVRPLIAQSFRCEGFVYLTYDDSDDPRTVP